MFTHIDQITACIPANSLGKVSNNKDECITSMLSGEGIRHKKNTALQ